MNNAIKNDSCDEKVWERHRSEIESLYWKHHLSDIDAHMKKRFGFVASKSQYERHFKKWKLRKNLTTPEWATIIGYVKENSIRLEEVEVLFRGHTIPQKRVQQEIARRSSVNQQSRNGSCKLPREITVRPRSRAPNMDTTNSLQISPPLVTSSLASSLHTEAGSDLVTITSPTINSQSLNEYIPAAGYSPSFSWMQLVNLDSFLLGFPASQQLTGLTRPSEIRLNAIFCSTYQSPIEGTHRDHHTVQPSYMIASLLNRVSLDGHTPSKNACALFKALPLSAVSQGLKALSTPIQDALKERIFVTAVKMGDLGLVSAMLKLKFDPWERIMMDWQQVSNPIYPLTFAIAIGHNKIARTLLSQMCQGANQSQLHELLGQIVEGGECSIDVAYCGAHRNESRMQETKELICIVLAAGASPIRECLSNPDPISIAHLKQLVASTAAGIMAWLEIGLLDYYLNKPEGYERPETLRDRESAANDILLCVFNDYRDHLPKGDPRLRKAMRDALGVAITERNESATRIILSAFNLFGYRLVGEEVHEEDICVPGFVNDSILEALDNEDWTMAASLMIAKGPDLAPSYQELQRELRDAITKKDLGHSLSLLRKHPILWYPLGSQVVEFAVRLGNDVNSIVRDMEDRGGSGDIGLSVLLEYGQTATLSALLTGHPVWRCALEAVSEKDDFGALEAMIFQGSPAPFMGGPSPEYKGDAVMGPCEHQLCFRAIAYHAIATNDFKLCKWLFALGIDADELLIIDLDDDSLGLIRKAPAMYCSFGGGQGELMDNVKHTLPSLLAVAAQHDDVVWISFLLAEGVSAVDSVALLRAIQTRASVVTIRLLLEAAEVRKSLAEQTYGVAAFRQAVRSSNFTLINILCKSVDMNAIEPFPEEFRSWSKLRYDVVSALGEAIITNDLEIVRILLCHGASPNAFVSLGGLKISVETRGYMQRVTPLLAAIDMKSLPMVKVLLEHGAELHYTRNMGIIRTPLQRAAETGCFDIVQYLIDQNASIDTIPVYTGATALQLAAMHGFCGIAAILLKHRADPNHPPSRGNGRTAFEAAAEQSHIDMMSLLMQCGVNLDLKFGTPPESQYERARRFAEENGFPASKRFVEHLYRQKLEHQSWDDLLVLDSP